MRSKPGAAPLPPIVIHVVPRVLSPTTSRQDTTSPLLSWGPIVNGAGMSGSFVLNAATAMAQERACRTSSRPICVSSWVILLSMNLRPITDVQTPSRIGMRSSHDSMRYVWHCRSKERFNMGVVPVDESGILLTLFKVPLIYPESLFFDTEDVGHMESP